MFDIEDEMYKFTEAFEKATKDESEKVREVVREELERYFENERWKKKMQNILQEALDNWEKVIRVCKEDV